MEDARVEERAALVGAFFGSVAYNLALGVEIVSLERGACTMVLPYREALIGHRDNGALHGGALTGLLDAACGAAVFMGIPRQTAIATLDLRVDFLGRSEADQDIIAEARCDHLTSSVAFASAVARYRDGTEVARAMGTFMIDSPASRERR